jgi:hypothetical protein
MVDDLPAEGGDRIGKILSVLQVCNQFGYSLLGNIGISRNYDLPQLLFSRRPESAGQQKKQSQKCPDEQGQPPGLIECFRTHTACAFVCNAVSHTITSVNDMEKGRSYAVILKKTGAILDKQPEFHYNI